MARHIVDRPFALTILNIKRSLDVERQLKGQVLEALIDEPHAHKRNDLLYRAGYLGLNAEALYRILFIQLDEASGSPPLEDMEFKQHLWEALALTGSGLQLKLAFYHNGESLVIACPVPQSEEGLLAKLVARFQQELEIRF